MVSTVTSYADLRNRALPSAGYDGVVRVSSGGYYGTGVLLYDGRAVLTAAHIFSGTGRHAVVSFETAIGSSYNNSSDVLINPNYDGSTNNDLAIVWLSSAAPVDANRYQLYRDTDEVGQAMTLVGYGKPGTGSTGLLSSYNGDYLRQKASNVFDADMSLLKRVLGASMAWNPIVGSQLVADFDDGTYAHDALGRLIGRDGLGLGAMEGVITTGDSGGPAFIQGKVAGVASYSASLYLGNTAPDADKSVNGTFGELAAWQRVSYYQQWIDQTMRAAYSDAPTKPEEISKRVAEGNAGTTYAYFLLQFTGVRIDANQVLSVDYATRDGTAIKGQDYVDTCGTLKLYPGEVQAVIPVEIIGDLVAEPDEVFYLDVTHPVGGSFGHGVVMLTAMRTIANDDGGWFAQG